MLDFSHLHRAVGDEVAIIRNEHDVDINLIFNANAGDPTANLLMDAPETYPGYTHMGATGHVHPGTISGAEGERHRDRAGTGQLW